MNTRILKYTSLITLTLQNALVGLSMSYSRGRSKEVFSPSTAVLMTEVVKLLTCLTMVFFEERDLKKFSHAIDTTIIKHPIDTLKVSVPSFLYIVQNNLLYVSASNLDAATYQVTYQLKILTTALFAVLILRKSLRSTQWTALLILVIGVILVQLAQNNDVDVVQNRTRNQFIGFSAALGACFLSGFAGVYFEKILKGSSVSVWMRNVQLSLLSLPIGLITCYLQDGETIQKRGFFYKYDAFVWYLVVLQAGGGLIVAMVVKYADNILKGFATSLAIIILCIASIYLFNFKLTVQFSFGALLVICSIFLYGYAPQTQSNPYHKIPADV